MLTLTLAQQQNAVSALYIALFNRAPDAAGFAFWVDGLAAGATLPATINAFLASPEALDIYTTGQTPEQFVAAFYETVFGRDADAGGLLYWTDVLNTAMANDPETAQAVLVTLIIETVSTSLPVKPEGLSDELYAQTVADRDLFGKKVTAGLGYAIDEQGNDLDAAKKVIADLTAPTTPEPEPTPSPGPVTPPPPPPPPPPGETYVLTENPDAFVGKNGDDTFDASLTINTLQTLQPSDTLDGGAGTDTLLATLNTSFNTAGVFTPSLKNIEVVKVTALAGASNIFNLDLSSGVTDVGSDGSDIALTFWGVKEAALSVSNQTQNVAFQGSTATALSLTLDKVGTQSTPISVILRGAGPTQAMQPMQATTHDIVANDANVRLGYGTAGVANTAVTTMTEAATGNNRLTLAEVDAATVTNLTVTGNGSVDFSDQALSALTTFTTGDGGVTLTSDNAAPGALTVKSGSGDDTITANGGSIKSLQTGGGDDAVILTDAALGNTARLNLGAGDDRLTLNTRPAAGAIIDGGEGRDILIVKEASLYHDDINAVKNFEVLAIGEDELGFNVAPITSLSAFMVAATGGTAFLNARDTDTFEIAVAPAYVQVRNADGQTKTDITLSNQTRMADDITVGTLDVSNISEVSLTSSNIDGAGSNSIGTLLHSDGTTIIVKGDTDLRFALSGAANGSTVDASAFTGNLHVTGTAFDDTITGGAGDDIFNAGLDQNNVQTLQRGDTLDGGAGTDTLLITQNDFHPTEFDADDAQQNGSSNYAPTLSNIEVIRVTNLDGVSSNLSLARATGVTHVGFEGSTAARAITSVGNAVLSVRNQNQDALFSGSTATTLSLNLEKVGTSAAPITVNLASIPTADGAKATAHNIVATDANVQFEYSAKNNAAVTSMTVEATGANVLTLASAAVGTLTNLTVSGSGSVDFSGRMLGALTNVVAGDGGIKLASFHPTADRLTIASGAGVDEIIAYGSSIKSLTTGGGNDIVTLYGSAPGSTARVELGAGDDWLGINEIPDVGAVLDGGEGRDTLSVSGSVFDYATINATTNFEVLAIGSGGNDVDVDEITVPGMTEFMITNNGATRFTHAKNDTKFEIAATTWAVTIANASGQTATDITLKNLSTEHTDLTVGTLDVTGITTVSLTSSSSGDTGSNDITTLRHSDDATIIVKGDTDLTFALSGVSKGSTVDATGFTGNLHVTGSAFSDRIIGGEGDDIIESGNFTTAEVTAVTESAVVTWQGFPANEANSAASQAAGGLYINVKQFEASPATTAAEVAAFVNGGGIDPLDTLSLSGHTGNQVGNWTFAAGAEPGTTVFTSIAPGTNVPDLTESGDISGFSTVDNAIPIVQITQGRVAVPATTNGSMDTLTGGGGADTFVFSTPDADSTVAAITATITDFVPGTDRILVSGGGVGSDTTLLRAAPADTITDLITLLSAAGTALNGSVKYFLGEFVDAGVTSTYLVTDDDGIGYTNVIKLTGIALDDFQNADLIASLPN